MKKLLMVAVAGMFMAGLSSCKKDYTCTCTGFGGSYSYTYKDAKKSAAKTACEGKGLGTIEDEDGDTWPASDGSCTLN